MTTIILSIPFLAVHLTEILCFLVIIGLFVLVGFLMETVKRNDKLSGLLLQEREKLEQLAFPPQRRPVCAPVTQGDNLDNNVQTRELLEQSLETLGCQCADSENGNLSFQYQGETFVVEVDDSPFIRIWDTWWHECDLDDVEAVSRLKKHINEANARQLVRTVYSFNESEKKMGVHCVTQILFIPQIPAVENYLKLILSSFFSAHRFLIAELQKEE